jgi:hypothetical protein
MPPPVLHGGQSPGPKKRQPPSGADAPDAPGLPGDLDPSSIPDCPADVSGDGFVDFVDLHLVLASWGPCRGGEPCDADISRDRAVDVIDLIRVIEAWGSCLP